MALIRFSHVSYTANDKNILEDFSCDIEKGDFISVVGPSGSGKSTFLKLCCHLITPTQGKILFHETDMMEQDPIQIRRKISYCFQSPVLFGNTVEDNFSFVYAIHKTSLDQGKIQELFSKFNLGPEFLTREIHSLSGGEKQRVALIRNLLFTPEVLLLDEVTSSLDTDNAAIVEGAIGTLNREGITVVWVTHHATQGRRYSNKILTLENGKIKSLEVVR